MSSLALPGSFEYLCHGSTAIINILILSVRQILQILTYKYGPRAESVNSTYSCPTVYVSKISTFNTFTAGHDTNRLNICSIRQSNNC